MQHTQLRPSNRASQGTCLIIEDSQFDSAKLTRIVEKSAQKMRVEVASTLRRARIALSRGQPRLILLDNNLPDGLGANFAMELSQDENLAKIPIIMVSDWPSPFMWEKAAAAGVSFVLSKSEFDFKYVRAALEKMKARKERMI
jgi:PleD family two-component response regulator